MNAAPTMITAFAVSGSSTVPAPITILSPALVTAFFMTPATFGVSAVISSVFIPPLDSASSIATIFCSSACRITATI